MRKQRKPTARIDAFAPTVLIDAVDHAAELQDMSRADYLRLALRAQLRRDGVPIRPRRQRRPPPQAATHEAAP